MHCICMRWGHSVWRSFASCCSWFEGQDICHPVYLLGRKMVLNGFMVYQQSFSTLITHNEDIIFMKQDFAFCGSRHFFCENIVILPLLCLCVLQSHTIGLSFTKEYILGIKAQRNQLPNTIYSNSDVYNDLETLNHVNDCSYTETVAWSMQGIQINKTWEPWQCCSKGRKMEQERG